MINCLKYKEKIVKLDITVGKKMTINTGNYSSIQPSISITAKDVDIENHNTVKHDLEVLCNANLLNQIKEDFTLMEGFKLIGLKEIIESLDINTMENDVSDSIRRLSTL
jgi:hypothetical protein